MSLDDAPQLLNPTDPTAITSYSPAVTFGFLFPRIFTATVVMPVDFNPVMDPLLQVNWLKGMA